MKICLIRHHATQGNKEKRYVGMTDEELLDESVQELKKVEQPIWGAIKDLKVFVSPLKRCVQTAEILFPQKELTFVDSFRECDFGQFEYKNYQELDGNPDYQRFIDTLGECGFPDGETKSEFQARCIKAFTQIVCENADKERLIFVVHGGTIMSILDAFSKPHQDYYSWQLRNGEAYVMHAEWMDKKLVCSSIRKVKLSDMKSENI